MDITGELYALASDKDRAFIQKLLPGCTLQILGIKTPKLRVEAKKIIKQGLSEEFLSDRHICLEEYLIHAFILEQIKDYGECLRRVNAFLPCVNNWMVCDQLSPKAFFGKSELIVEIEKWLLSDHPFTVRFGLVMLKRHFLDENFDKSCLDLAASVKSDEYYVLMAKAWYFAEAAAKQYEAAVPYFARGRLDDFTHNMAIRKATESFRVSPPHKEQLKSLR